VNSVLGASAELPESLGNKITLSVIVEGQTLNGIFTLPSGISTNLPFTSPSISSGSIVLITENGPATFSNIIVTSKPLEPSVPVPCWAEYEGFDSVGNDIACFPVEDEITCKAACAVDTDCVAYITYENSQLICCTKFAGLMSPWEGHKLAVQVSNCKADYTTCLDTTYAAYMADGGCPGLVEAGKSAPENLFCQFSPEPFKEFLFSVIGDGWVDCLDNVAAMNLVNCYNQLQYLNTSIAEACYKGDLQFDFLKQSDYMLPIQGSWTNDLNFDNYIGASTTSDNSGDPDIVLLRDESYFNSSIPRPTNYTAYVTLFSDCFFQQGFAGICIRITEDQSYCIVVAPTGQGGLAGQAFLGETLLKSTPLPPVFGSIVLAVTASGPNFNAIFSLPSGEAYALSFSHSLLTSGSVVLINAGCHTTFSDFHILTYPRKTKQAVAAYTISFQIVLAGYTAATLTQTILDSIKTAMALSLGLSPNQITLHVTFAARRSLSSGATISVQLSDVAGENYAVVMTQLSQEASIVKVFQDAGLSVSSQDIVVSIGEVVAGSTQKPTAKPTIKPTTKPSSGQKLDLSPGNKMFASAWLRSAVFLIVFFLSRGIE
jgi:hypothetical protein